MRIGIIGFGKMGEAIAQGLKESGTAARFSLQGTTRLPENAKEISRRLSINCHSDNEKLIASSDVILLCVKPHQAKKVLEATASKIHKKQLLLSICASVTTRQLADWSGGEPAIVRAMPNTPCLIRQGMTVFCAGPKAEARDLAVAQEIFGTLGKTVVIEETLMDGATGLSGCGPAFVYLIIEALSEGGVKTGLSRKVSTLLAAQTLAGAAQMVLTRDIHPAALKDEVTTPAGCTIDGLMALEEGKVRVTLVKAVLAAATRSKNLSKEG